MYDTKFLIKTNDLKKKIITKSIIQSESEDILTFLNSAILPIPFIFNIETTSVCNMSCIMCQRTTNFLRKSIHMSDAVFNAILDQITSQKEEDLIRWKEFTYKSLNRTNNNQFSENDFYYDIVSNCVTLHGFGEPLLDPKLPERISALREKGIKTYFSCNPCNINLSFLKKILLSGVDAIKFALDSLDDDEAKKIRGQKADFSNSYQKILGVLELKKELHSPTKIVITMLNLTGNVEMGNNFLTLWEGKPVTAYVKSVDNVWLIAKTNEKKKDLKKENKSHYAKQYCEFPWTSVTILVDGTVVPCTQDINATWNFGNITETSLSDIWKSQKYQDFRKNHCDPQSPKDFMCKTKCDIHIVSDFYLCDNK